MPLKKLIAISALIVTLLVLAPGLNAQFYKVYGYQPAEAGEIEFSLWNSHIPSSDNSYLFFGKELSRQGLWAHSLELEYGLSNKFGVALYADFEDPAGGSLKFVRTKALMAHCAFFDKGSRPVDIGIYLEYIVNKKDYRDYEELELRLILEKDIGAFRIDFNPIFEKKTSGSGVSEGVEFNYALGIYYLNNEEGIFASKTFVVLPGIEFYGKLGEMADFDSGADQRHFIFPTLDLFIGRRIHWHTGIGFGLTSQSDRITWKSIVSYVVKF